jgi:hypothetical protein
MRSLDAHDSEIVLPLIVSVAVVSLLFAAYQVRTGGVPRNDLSAGRKFWRKRESVEPLLDRARRIRTCNVW